MTVNFYRISDDFRVVNKSLGTPLATLSLAFLDTVSLANPRIVISYNATIATCNYMEFVEAEKFYFFPQPSLGAGGRLYIVGTDDVLMNNRTKILELDAYVVRSESNGNSLMLDSKRPVQANRHCITEPFSQHPFSGDSDVSGIKYVLTVIGGQKNEVEST